MNEVKAGNSDINGGAVLSDEGARIFEKEHPNWRKLQKSNCEYIERRFSMPAYSMNFDFARRIGDLAEQNKRYPIIEITEKECSVRWNCGENSRLHQHDCSMAAQTDEIFLELFHRHEG
ncbi:MAG: hypothetical protein GF350_02845 [Chitinivibrionales bacterium]|nr:hypothetical protein [Chitinivibrionales bacterium]